MKKLFGILACSIALLASSCSKENPGEPGGDPGSNETIYAVGDYYNVSGVKGIVYKIKDGGKHGMIISMDQGVKEWALSESVTNATNVTNGVSNMNTIATIDATMSNFPAFKWCKEKNTGSITGWYLPAKSDVSDIAAVYLTLQVALQQNGGNTFASNMVWSSTESDNQNAWAVDMNNKTAYEHSKSLEYTVRAVKPF